MEIIVILAGGDFTGRVFCSTPEGEFVKAFGYTNGQLNGTLVVMKRSELKKMRMKNGDNYYKVDTNGKFQLTKQVKYKPQSYTQAYLADKTKNIWDGNEIPLE